MKYFKWMVVLLLPLMTACSSGGSATDEPPVFPTERPEVADRTILVYLAADNNLGSLGFAAADIQEMKLGMEKLIGQSTHLLYYIDTPGREAKLVEIDAYKDAPVEVEIRNYGKGRNSVGLQETQEVLQDVFNNPQFKADSYGLIYWSHGEGWRPDQWPALSSRSIGYDSSSNRHTMSIPDLAEALSVVPKLDFLLFDACFMLSVEVAYELQEQINYMIGSPTEIPGPGARYDRLLPALFSKETGNKLAKAAVEGYYDPYAETFQPGVVWKGQGEWCSGVSCGAINCKELKHLAEISQKYLPEQIDYESLKRLVFDYDRREASFSNDHIGYYDLYQCMQQLIPVESYWNEWKEAYHKALPYWQTTSNNLSAFVHTGFPREDVFSMESTYGLSCYLMDNNRPREVAAYKQMQWYQDLFE